LSSAASVPAFEFRRRIIWMVNRYVMIDAASAALAPGVDTGQVQHSIGLAVCEHSSAPGSLLETP
jgi:hypothetical protein